MSDQKQLAQLFAAHAKQVQRFFQRRLGRADAQDLNQEVFLRLLRLKDLESIADPQGYLFTVAANLLRERTHSATYRRLQARLPIEAVLEAPELAVESSAEGELDRDFLLHRLQTAVDQLLPQDRQILTLIYKERLTYREIAQRLQMSKSAVEHAVGRAIGRCRKLMDLEENS